MKRALVFLLISLSLALLADWYSINESTSTQLLKVNEDQANITNRQFNLDEFEFSTEDKDGITFQERSELILITLKQIMGFTSICLQIL